MSGADTARMKYIARAAATVRLLLVGWGVAGLAIAQPTRVEPHAQSAEASTAASSASAGSTQDDAPRFDVLEYQIEGNSVLSVEAIEKAVTPYLGSGRTLADVESARSELEHTYQAAGYLTVFVDIPEQKVDGGTVVLAVTEGKVSHLRVSGSRYFSQGYIRDKVPELADGRVPNFNEVQRQLAVVNRSEERRVQPIMRAGQAPGTVETELKVDDKLPLSGSIEVNNRNSPNTTPMRVSGLLRYSNLFQRDHSIALGFTTAPQKVSETKVFSLTYTIPEDDQSAWVLYALHSDSTVAPLGSVTVLGKGNTYGLRRVWPLPASAGIWHTLAVGADYKDLQEQTRTGDAAISTPLRYLPFQLGYNATVDHDDKSQTTAGLTAVAAARWILRRDVDCVGVQSDQFACKRQGGDGSFAYLRADLKHLLPVGHDEGLTLRLGGQWANQPLVSAEQYVLGGAETVRGYLEAEASGDRGVFGSLELRSRNLLSAQPGAAANQFRLLAFADAGRVYTLEASVGQPAHATLASAGLGLRVKLQRVVSGDLDVAWPRHVAGADERRPRLHARLMVEL